MALERVQKIIARAGMGSRRRAEDLIREGLVTINGKVAKLGDQAEAGKDAIKVNGKLLQLNQPPVYLAFNKPKAVICTIAPDPQGRPNVGTYLSKIKTRIYPVGRMDFNSEGLMLLTNDGDFAEKLQKSAEVVRIYNVKVKGHPETESLRDLAKPMRVEGRSVAPHSVRVAGEFTQKSMIEVVFVGWSAVDIKAFFEKKGFLVERIIRMSIGQVNLHGLAPGHYRFLKKSQIDAILDQPELVLRGKAEEELPAPRRADLLPVPRATSRNLPGGLPRQLARPSARRGRVGGRAASAAAPATKRRGRRLPS